MYIHTCVSTSIYLSIHPYIRAYKNTSNISISFYIYIYIYTYTYAYIYIYLYIKEIDKQINE